MNPWEEEDSIWKTKAAYLAWVRGNLRKMWTKYPPKNKFKQKMAREAQVVARAKKEGQCVFCKEWFAISSLQVDHIEECGSLTELEDIGPFVQRLLCTQDNMQLTCNPCHKIKTLSERKSISFEEAKKEKKVIAFMKTPLKFQKQQLLEAGATEEEISNSKKRREAANKYLW